MFLVRGNIQKHQGMSDYLKKRVMSDMWCTVSPRPRNDPCVPYSNMMFLLQTKRVHCIGLAAPIF